MFYPRFFSKIKETTTKIEKFPPNALARPKILSENLTTFENQSRITGRKVVDGRGKKKKKR